MGNRSIHCRTALLEDGWRHDVLLDLDGAGTIRAITQAPCPSGAVGLDGPVVPGMPNVHSHGFQRLLVGLTGRRSASSDSFWTWREAMYRLALRLDPERLEACMGGVYLGMLAGGYTSCAEFHYLHHDAKGRPYANPAEMSERVIAAALAAGIGLTHLPVLYCRSGFGASAVTPEQRRFATAPEAYLGILEASAARVNAHPGLQVGVAPHSLRAVNEEELREVLARGARSPCPVHIHVAEQPVEVEECLAHLGARPVEWLLDHFEVDANWCLVHATHADRSESARAARAGAVAGLCPTTEADLGDGTFDAVHWAGCGGHMGVGSDSNLVLSATGELRLLEFTQRLRTGSRNVLADPQRSCGRFLWETCAAGGALALGQPVGRIAVGCRADLVELDHEDPLLAGLQGDAVLDAWVFAGGARTIRSVHVGGDRRIERGVHARGEELTRAYTAVMRDLRS